MKLFAESAKGLNGFMQADDGTHYGRFICPQTPTQLNRCHGFGLPEAKGVSGFATIPAVGCGRESILGKYAGKEV